MIRYVVHFNRFIVSCFHFNSIAFLLDNHYKINAHSIITKTQTLKPQVRQDIVSTFLASHAASQKDERRRPSQYSPSDIERASCGYVGLKNFGCTCYFNSLMQQFFMMPVFRDAILTLEHENDEEENGKEDEEEERKAKRRRLKLVAQDTNDEKKESKTALIRELKLMFAHLKLSRRKYYVPKGFISLKQGRESLLKTVEQQDVDEFFRILMDRLEKELKYTSKPDFLTQFFGGVLINQIIPQGCPRDHRIEREENFYALQLGVKNKPSILHSLESYVFVSYHSRTKITSHKSYIQIRRR